MKILDRIKKLFSSKSKPKITPKPSQQNCHGPVNSVPPRPIQPERRPGLRCPASDVLLTDLYASNLRNYDNDNYSSASSPSDSSCSSSDSGSSSSSDSGGCGGGE